MRLTLILLAVVAAADARPWSCYHGDPQHTGRSDQAVGDSLWQIWTYPAGGDISGSAAVDAHGRVYFGARDVHLYCIEPGGTLRWQTDLSHLGSSIYFSTPALDESGCVYITTNRKLVKVDSAGSVVWYFPEHSSWSISHSPTIGVDGNIYFAAYSDSLYAVTPGGSLAWAFALGAPANSSPAVGHDGRVFIATTRGSAGWKLHAVEANGSAAWSYDIAGEADFASPTVGADSTIYVGADRHLYAVRSDGSLKWRDSLNASITSCPAVGNDSTLYVVAGSRLNCVSADSGIRWSVSLGGSNYSAPAVDAGGFVYVGSAANALHLIDPEGDIRLSLTLPGAVWASPAIGPHGRVFVGCMSGTLHAFEGPSSALALAVPASARAGLCVEPTLTAGSIRLVGSDAGSVRRVRAFDAAGRERRARVSGARIDLADLPSGVYVLSVEVGAESRLLRVTRR